MTGLRFQTISVQIDGGYNDGTDSFVSDQPSNDELLDVRFDERQQLAKRFGIEERPGSITSSYGPVHSLVDVDGILHTVGPGAVTHYDPVIQRFTSSSFGAPRHCEVKTDPIVRSNDDARRPDTAISNDYNLMVQVWEDLTTGLAYYQFFSLEGEDKTPVSITTPKVWTGNARFGANVKVVRLNNTFVAVGCDNATGVALGVSVFQIGSTAYTFSDPVHIDTIGVAEKDFQVIANANGNDIVYIGYRRNGTDIRVVTFDHTATFIATLLVQFSGYAVLALFHHTLNQHILLGTQNGVIKVIAEDISSVIASHNIFSVPSSGCYNDFDFKRGVITREKDGRVWFARSPCQECGYTTFPAVGATVGFHYTNGITQLAILNSSYSIILQTVCPRVVIVSQGGYLTDTGLPLFVVADQNALQTQDMGGATAAIGARLASPIAYVVQPVFGVVQKGSKIITSQPVISLVHHARLFQDKIDTTQNCNPVTERVVAFSTHYWNYHTGQLNATTSDNPMFFSTSVIAEQVYGFTNAFQSSLYRYSADLARIKVGYTKAVRDVQTSNIKLLGGGAGCTFFDSVRGTNNTPDAPSALSSIAPMTSSIGIRFTGPGVVYQHYRVLYKFFDEKGNEHRSAPSSVAISNVGAETAKDSHEYYPLFLHFPNPFPSGLMGDGFLDPLVCQVEVYARKTDGTVFRKIATITPAQHPYDEGQLCVLLQWAGSFTTIDYPQIDVDVSPDFDTYPQLYTESGELPPWPTPPLVDLCSFQSRLWGISAESRLDVWYSKPIVQGFTPEFTPTNVITIPQEGGECIGLAALDDKIVVFKQRKIYKITGDAGDKNGDNSNLFAQLISGDVGVINPQSIVEGPFGVAFQTTRGFYTLSRGLEFSFIGEDVKNYLDPSVDLSEYKITNGTLVDSTSEVRWTIKGEVASVGADSVIITETPKFIVTDLGQDLLYQEGQPTTTAVNQTLVWNYRLEKWSIWSNTQANDACMSQGVWNYIGAPGKIITETPNVWNYFSANDDDADNPHLKVRTSWIKLGSMANFKRVRRILATLKYFSGGITVRTRTNYSGTWDTLRYWTQAELLTLVDPVTKRLQLDIRPEIQVCESMQIEINEGEQKSDACGRAFELMALQMEVGVRNTTNFKGLPKAAQK